MVLVQCRICGGQIEHNEDRAYGICPHCDNSMTLPRGADALRIGRFNQAVALLRSGDDLRAGAEFQNLIKEDDSDPEAHWGLVLARYGVRYVKDRNTGRYEPVCQNIKNANVLTDENYLAALNRAPDEHARGLYREQAERIAFCLRNGTQFRPAPLQQSPETVVGLADAMATTPNALTLITRAQLFLEDGDFQSADAYADKVLDFAPRYAPAYMVRLQSKLRVRYEHELGEGMESLEHDADYQKALRFADPAQKQVYQGYNERIMKRLESNHKENAYQAALQQAQTAKSEAEYRKAAETFRALSGYRDAGSQEEQALMKAEEARLNQSRQDDEKGKKRQKARKVLSISMAVLALAGAAMYLLFTQVVLPHKASLAAKELLNNEQYEEAADTVTAPGESAENAETVKESQYQKGLVLLENKQYALALNVFRGLNGYADSAMMEKETIYRKALELLGNKQYDEASRLFGSLGNYSDSEKMLKESNFQKSMALEKALAASEAEKMQKEDEFKRDWAVGRIVTFGVYEQDDNPGNGMEPIRWRVLARDKDAVLLISDDILDYYLDSEYLSESGWKHSKLRKWLNEEFAARAFSEDESHVILEAYLNDENETRFLSEKVNPDGDFVFLLSMDDVRAHMMDLAERLAGTTRYAQSKGAYTSGEGRGRWLLRNEIGGYADLIGATGGLIRTSNMKSAETGGIRPSIWVNLSLLKKAAQSGSQ